MAYNAIQARDTCLTGYRYFPAILKLQALHSVSLGVLIRSKTAFATPLDTLMVDPGSTYSSPAVLIGMCEALSDNTANSLLLDIQLSS